MLVLFETPAGYAVFKYADEKKLTKVDEIWKEFDTSAKAQERLQLVDFKSFKTVPDALSAANATSEGKLSKTLRKLLKTQSEETESLAVGDVKVGNLIKERFDNLKCVNNAGTSELMRAIRMHMDTLLADYKAEIDAMRLALAHALARYKVKFNPEKIDTMIVQAVSLLDDLDKELNNYSMRTREWFGWHFPELSRLVQDHVAYAKVVKAIGMKQDAQKAKLVEIVPEELEQKIKEEAEMSMGTDITSLDLEHIQLLCDEVISLNEYRSQLFDYLKNRMHALAPNLTVLLGELVGARMISRAGSLVSLAKLPSSTVQLLGAEKALFRALKTKKDTPKYGIIYHAQLVSQTTTRLKGKIARKLAAKVSLSTRIDALCDESLGNTTGIEHRALLEQIVKAEQERPPKRFTGSKQTPHAGYKFKQESQPYNQNRDFSFKRKASESASAEEEPAYPKKKIKPEATNEMEVDTPVPTSDDYPKSAEKKKKSKKHDKAEAPTNEE